MKLALPLLVGLGLLVLVVILVGWRYRSRIVPLGIECSQPPLTLSSR